MMLMPSCQEVRENLTEFMEGTLPFRKRVGIHLHLMMCRMCDELRKALAALPGLAKQALGPPSKAPAEAQDVLGHVLSQLKGPPPS